jgi:cobalt-zinc-cadmium resistance protein CzcA
VIQPDPARLAARGLSLDMLAEIVEQNTRNAGGGYVEIGGEQLIIRAASRVNDLEQILNIPLKLRVV